MFWIGVALVALAYGGVCAVAGFGPIGGLDEYQPEHGPLVRRFTDDPRSVLAAYRAAIERTPGMALRDERGPTLLVDARPTSRILGGDYGQAIRVTVSVDDRGTLVTADARHKVRFGLGNHESAFTHSERALRMQAKSAGLNEAIAGFDGEAGAGVGPTHTAIPPVGLPQRSYAVSPAAASGPAPGWYADPSDPGSIRYWDGRSWTDRRAPRPVG